MAKAIIVELNKNHVIILAEGGTFKKIKRTGQLHAVGQEIEVEEASSLRSGRLGGFYNWKSGAAAAVAALLLFFQFFYPFTGNEIYASVSIEMDPSLEVEIDKQLNVIKISAYNKEGKDILKKLQNWDGRHFEEVARDIFRISSEKGYISGRDEVLLTTTLAEDVPDEKAGKLKKHVSRLVEKEAEKQNLVMTSVVISHDEKAKAEKHGMTAGQYAIMIAARQKGRTLSSKQLKDKSIEQISKEIGPVKDLFKVEAPPALNKEAKKVPSPFARTASAAGKPSQAKPAVKTAAGPASTIKKSEVEEKRKTDEKQPVHPHKESPVKKHVTVKKEDKAETGKPPVQIEKVTPPSQENSAQKQEKKEVAFHSCSAEKKDNPEPAYVELQVREEKKGENVQVSTALDAAEAKKETSQPEPELAGEAA